MAVDRSPFWAASSPPSSSSSPPSHLTSTSSSSSTASWEVGAGGWGYGIWYIIRYGVPAGCPASIDQYAYIIIANRPTCS